MRTNRANRPVCECAAGHRPTITIVLPWDLTAAGCHPIYYPSLETLNPVNCGACCQAPAANDASSSPRNEHTLPRTHRSQEKPLLRYLLMRWWQKSYWATGLGFSLCDQPVCGSRCFVTINIFRNSNELGKSPFMMWNKEARTSHRSSLLRNKRPNAYSESQTDVTRFNLLNKWFFQMKYNRYII